MLKGVQPRVEWLVLHVVLSVHLALDQLVGQYARTLQAFFIIYKLLQKSWREVLIFPMSRQLCKSSLEPFWTTREITMYANLPPLLNWHAYLHSFRRSHWSHGVFVILLENSALRLESHGRLCPIFSFVTYVF